MATIIIAIIVLSILVFVHELGHFLAARRFGVKAEEFGLGLPSRIFGVYKNKNGKWATVVGNKEVNDASDTIFSLNWIFLGGFVKIKGEDGEDDKSEDSFSSKKIWQRAVMLSAGVLMNIVLAFILFSIIFTAGFPQPVDDGKGNIQIVQVMENSAAQKAGISQGDIIVSIDGNYYTKQEDVIDYINKNTDKNINVEIRRGKKIFNNNIKPSFSEKDGRGIIGVALSNTSVIKYPWHIAIWEAIKYIFLLSILIIKAFYNLIIGGISFSDVAGPIGIVKYAGQASQLGLVYLMNFTAFLSVNLAIINFLPIPALDGGRVLFLIIEKIRRKSMKKQLEAGLNQIFLLLLLLLMLVVSVKEINYYFGDNFKSLWDKLF